MSTQDLLLDIAYFVLKWDIGVISQSANHNVYVRNWQWAAPNVHRALAQFTVHNC